jgi:L-iditol 2-dehydrogenase
VKLPAQNAVKLSDGVSYYQGAFLEPTTVALHGLALMGFKGGSDVGVLGTGTIGLLALQCARALGARRIFAFDINHKRLEVAKEYGADFCFCTDSEDFRHRVLDLTGGRGLPAVIETGGVEFTEKLSLELAANKGSIMFIGTPSQSITLSQREFEHMNRKELTVRGSWMSYSAPFPGEEWELADHYLDRGLVRVDKLIDRISPLSDIEAVFADIAIPGRVSGKVLLTP